MNLTPTPTAEDKLAKFIVECRADKKKLEANREALQACHDKTTSMPIWKQDETLILLFSIVAAGSYIIGSEVERRRR